jgi:CRP/FNR family transcriptional regulator
MKRLADRLALSPPTNLLGHHSSPANSLVSNLSNAPHLSVAKGRIASLGDQLIRQLPTEYVHKTKIASGAYVTRSGEAMQFLYLLDAGAVKVEYSLPNGQYQIITFLYPGNLFGSDGVLTGTHYYDQIALSDGVVYRISFEVFNRLMPTQTNLAHLYEKIMSQAVAQAQDHVFSLGKHTTEQKLALFLLDFQDRQPNSVLDLRLPMGRIDLASYLGITIESLSRAFAFLERNHLVQVSNRLLTDLHVNGLVKLLG